MGRAVTSLLTTEERCAACLTKCPPTIGRNKRGVKPRPTKQDFCGYDGGGDHRPIRLDTGTANRTDLRRWNGGFAWWSDTELRRSSAGQTPRGRLPERPRRTTTSWERPISDKRPYGLQPLALFSEPGLSVLGRPDVL